MSSSKSCRSPPSTRSIGCWSVHSSSVFPSVRAVLEKVRAPQGMTRAIHSGIIHTCSSWQKHLLDGDERTRALIAVYTRQGFRELALDLVHQLGCRSPKPGRQLLRRPIVSVVETTEPLAGEHP